MTEPFLFTVPSGEPVEVEPFHYAIVGQTQFSGKTTLIKRLSKWAVDQGFKVLIFDTKETAADYTGFGREIPVCLRETTDSFVLIGLLESLFKRRLTRYYATLSRITEGAEGFDDTIENAKELEQKTRSSWLKDACRVLYDLLERLKNETAKVETVSHLKLYPGLNRMVINDFSLEAQQLIVKNAYEDFLRIYKRDSIGVLDEAFKFIPQGYNSPATQSIMHVMTQGGKTRLFTWISTQFLAVTDKGPLKACPFKFLGTQDHTTEVRHTLDLIPEVRARFVSDDIMRLKLGHWILVRKRPPDVRVVYALPYGVPSHVGGKVAVGELKPEQVRDHYLKPTKKEDEDLVYKEKWKEEQRKRIKAENELLVAEKKLETFETFKKSVEQLEKEKADLEKELETYNKLREVLGEILLPIKAETMKKLDAILASPVGEPSQIGLQATTTIVDVPPAIKQPTISQETIRGKVLTLIKIGFLDNWQGLGDVHKELIEKFGWTLSKASLQRELNRMVDDFLLGAKRDSGRKQRVYHVAANVKFKEAEA